MRCHCYTRAENEASATEVRNRMFDTCNAQGWQRGDFQWDGLSGQRGLTHTLRKLQPGDVLMVNALTDLGKDVPSLIKQIDELLYKNISVNAIATNLHFSSDDVTASEPRIIRALAQAHVHYIRNNRRTGLAFAKARGSAIGRPKVWTLDATRKRIADLTDAKNGTLPTVLEVAKAVGCGKTKASELLREYVAEQKELSKQAGSRES